MKKIPMRMCIACRERFDKRQLLRIIRGTDGEIDFDPTGKKNGRGMYICTKPECVDKLKITKLVNNALETEVGKETLEVLHKKVTEYIKNNSKEREDTYVAKKGI